jgi:uncharacterized membrane protein YfcA
VGSFAGYLGGLLGVGGGNFIVPVLVWLGFNPKKAAATTAFIVIFSSFSGFLGHASLGNIDMQLLAFCATGSVAGALFGAYLMKKKLSGKQVKVAIGLILYLIAVKMIWDLIKWDYLSGLKREINARMKKGRQLFSTGIKGVSGKNQFLFFEETKRVTVE